MSKVYMGVRLQRLREEQRITQVALAKALGISPSYLNQIERNQRPLTVPILLRINAQFGVDVQFFAEDDEARLIADVRDVLADTGAGNVSVAETRSLASNMPEIARAVVELHRRGRAAAERADTLAAQLGDGHKLASLSSPAPRTRYAITSTAATTTSPNWTRPPRPSSWRAASPSARYRHDWRKGWRSVTACASSSLAPTTWLSASSPSMPAAACCICRNTCVPASRPSRWRCSWPCWSWADCSTS